MVFIYQTNRKVMKTYRELTEGLSSGINRGNKNLYFRFDVSRLAHSDYHIACVPPDTGLAKVAVYRSEWNKSKKSVATASWQNHNPIKEISEKEAKSLVKRWDLLIQRSSEIEMSSRLKRAAKK